MERKGIIEQTSRVRGMCREIYDLARVTGRATHNPLEGLHKFLQTKPVENYAHVSQEEPYSSLMTFWRNSGMKQAKALLDVGGKLYAASRMINRVQYHSSSSIFLNKVKTLAVGGGAISQIGETNIAREICFRCNCRHT